MKLRQMLNTLLIIPGLILLAGCAGMNQKIDATELAAALQAGDRADADKQRDAGRKPAEVIAFLGVTPGMTMMDLIAAGGYYSEVLAEAVGPDGIVYAQNPASVLKFRDGANDRAMTARLRGNRLPNVRRLDREIRDLGLEAGSLDGVITALNLHDIYNNSPDNALAALKVIKVALKSGGFIGVVDHNGNKDADNAKLHRMQAEQAITLGEQAGFVVESSDILANPEDDRSRGVFAPGIRGKTDRFVLKFVNP